MYSAVRCFMFSDLSGFVLRSSDAAPLSCGLCDKLYACLADCIHVPWISLRLCGRARHSRTYGGTSVKSFSYFFQNHPAHVYLEMSE